MSKNDAISSFGAEDPLTLVIFGGTGDLTRRKLLPGLYAMHLEGLLPKKIAIVCHGRRDYNDEMFRPMMEEDIKKHSRLKVNKKKLSSFLNFLYYFKGNLDSSDDFEALATRCKEDKEWPDNHVFYLATAPGFFGSTTQMLVDAGMIRNHTDKNWSRVVVEKPFGTDLASAQALNSELLRLLHESQVYRIDHYLGKETVQNIISFRFANTIFEPIFNSQYVDHIQITASETVGMESGRGGYYDQSGALRDMMQNHLLQLLCFVTMEPPSGLAADAIRAEKVKVLQSIRPPTEQEVCDNVIRAQYSAGKLGDDTVNAYVMEDRVPADSTTATFVAAKLFIENWRWGGVPMYLRTGKRLNRKYTSISIVFKIPPLKIFKTIEEDDEGIDITQTQPNVMTFHLAPQQGISLEFAAKRPAMQLVVENESLDFRYDADENLPEAYERLLLDAMRGDSTLFMRSDEVEAAWAVVDPILKAWESQDDIPVHLYQPGGWGPREAGGLIKPNGKWQNPE